MAITTMTGKIQEHNDDALYDDVSQKERGPLPGSRAGRGADTIRERSAPGRAYVSLRGTSST
eukprot:6020465-Amphidinium_carterae.1